MESFRIKAKCDANYSYVPCRIGRKVTLTLGNPSPRHRYFTAHNGFVLTLEFGLRVRLVSYEPDLERVCAAAMRSCYSPHPGYELFTYTGGDKALEGERVFDQERVAGLLKRALELGHYDIMEHNSITWLVEVEDREILTLLNSSRFFEATKLDEKRWLVTTNLRVLVELARGKNQTSLARELASTLDAAAPSIASVLKTGG